MKNHQLRHFSFSGCRTLGRHGEASLVFSQLKPLLCLTDTERPSFLHVCLPFPRLLVLQLCPFFLYPTVCFPYTVPLLKCQIIRFWLVATAKTTSEGSIISNYAVGNEDGGSSRGHSAPGGWVLLAVVRASSRPDPMLQVRRPPINQRTQSMQYGFYNSTNRYHTPILST